MRFDTMSEWENALVASEKLAEELRGSLKELLAAVGSPDWICDHGSMCGTCAGCTMNMAIDRATEVLKGVSDEAVSGTPT